MTNAENSKRIARNTALLYVRMFGTINNGNRNLCQ